MCSLDREYFRGCEEGIGEGECYGEHEWGESGDTEGLDGLCGCGGVIV